MSGIKLWLSQVSGRLVVRGRPAARTASAAAIRKVHPARLAPMPAETEDFAMFPPDWHSADYVAEWIARDVTRDPERRSLLRQMLSFAPFPCEAVPDVLDVGAGYGVVSEEVVQAVPSARITLQDYSGPMLARASALNATGCATWCATSPTRHGQRGSAAPSTSPSPPSPCTICAIPKRS